jgi:hypothetical protein
MSNDDVLFRFRLRVIALARELRSVREACRMMEVHPSSFYCEDVMRSCETA